MIISCAKFDKFMFYFVCTQCFKIDRQSSNLKSNMLQSSINQNPQSKVGFFVFLPRCVHCVHFYQNAYVCNVACGTNWSLSLLTSLLLRSQVYTHFFPASKFLLQRQVKTKLSTTVSTIFKSGSVIC